MALPTTNTSLALSSSPRLTPNPRLAPLVIAGLVVGIIALIAAGVLTGVHYYPEVQRGLFIGGGVVTAWSMIQSLMHYYAVKRVMPRVRAGEILSHYLERDSEFRTWYDTNDMSESTMELYGDCAIVTFTKPIPNSDGKVPTITLVRRYNSPGEYSEEYILSYSDTLDDLRGVSSTTSPTSLASAANPAQFTEQPLSSQQAISASSSPSSFITPSITPTTSAPQQGGPFLTLEEAERRLNNAQGDLTESVRIWERVSPEDQQTILQRYRTRIATACVKSLITIEV